MRIRVDGTQQTSRRLRKLHDRLEADQQKWIFTQLLDDMYTIQRIWWARKFGGKQDKAPRKGNPPAYMFQSGGLLAAATTKRGAGSLNMATSRFALISVKGRASKLAGIHRGQDRDVIADLTRRDNRNLTDSMARFIFAAAD